LELDELLRPVKVLQKIIFNLPKARNTFSKDGWRGEGCFFSVTGEKRVQVGNLVIFTIITHILKVLNMKRNLLLCPATAA